MQQSNSKANNETPRGHQKTVSNGRNVLNGKLPIPLYKQASMSGKTRNTSNGTQSLYNAANLLTYSGSQIDITSSVLSQKQQNLGKHRSSLTIDPNMYECQFPDKNVPELSNSKSMP